MENAKKSLDVFSTSLSKCISACGSVTQQLLPRWPQHSRPFRVVNSDHSVKKGIMVNNLEDLRNKDGTGVDTEDFFQTLKENTVIMVLGEGQKWAPQQRHLPGQKKVERAASQSCDLCMFLGNQCMLFRIRIKAFTLNFSYTELTPEKHTTKSDPGCSWKKPRKDVAKLTFDLYKNHPQDFIGCLNVQATLEVLKWTLFTMQTTGHILVGTSCYIQHLIDEDEKTEAQLISPACFIKELQH
ncbi:Cell death activator CIDE-3 [Labeo rohita]|uniref:Cell death activator CIDE-3 n=1 Tax=Labeo rohita TaxID=84645 RepID=A0ABQ8MKN1_LABRO|nr:Cell death activator CIDE-3 [Labeo rohita]